MNKALTWIEIIALTIISLFLILLINWPSMLFTASNISKIDHQYHDTYFVVGDLYYVYVLALWFITLVWIYLRVLPKYIASYIQHSHFVLTLIATTLMLLPMPGLNPGIPMSYADYPLSPSYFDQLNLMAVIGGWVFIVCQIALVALLAIKYFRSK